MGGITDFLFGSPSKQKSSSSSSSTSGNAAYGTISNALTPTLGYGAQAGNMMASLLGLSTPTVQQPATYANPTYNYNTAGPGPTYGEMTPTNGSDYSIIDGGYDGPLGKSQYLNDLMQNLQGGEGQYSFTDGTPVATVAPGGGGQSTSGLDAFANSGGMDFLRDQGVKAIEASQAGKGMLQSGATGQALSTFGNNLAKTYLNDYLSHLMDYASLGTKNAAVLGSAGAYGSSSSSGTGSGTGGKNGLIPSILGGAASNPALPGMIAAFA